jgi:class 3 adenylate cyclase
MSSAARPPPTAQTGFARTEGRCFDRVATLLVTDIVDSSARALELGDGRWRDLLARHDQAVRAVLDRFRGREVTTTGDGFVAVFDGAERAIHAAQEIGRAASGIGLEARAAVLAGSPIGFTDRGLCELKGLSEGRRVYVVEPSS